MRGIKSYLSLIPPIVISLIIVVVLRNFFNLKSFAIDLSTAGVFLALFGVIYAIMIGFLIVTVLERFSALSTVVEEELNAIEDVWPVAKDTFSLFPFPLY
jgi:hypothetical protein